METVYVEFKVTVKKHSGIWSRSEEGTAELSFDLPANLVGTVNMSEILQSLLPVAYQDYVMANNGEKEE